MGSPIPATLPALLHSGTGVHHDHYGALVVVGPSGDRSGRYDCAAPDSGYSLHPDTLTLDLDSPTSRAHLAWWFDSLTSLPEPKPADRAAYWRAYVTAYPKRAADVVEWAFCQDFGTRGQIIDAMRAFREGKPVSPAQLDILTTVARHLAGLESE